MFFVQVLPQSGLLAEPLSRALHQGDAAGESSAIKISQQLLIGCSVDVRRHSPKTGTLFLRERSPPPTTAIQSSQPHTFVPDSFNHNSEVLYQLSSLELLRD